MTSLEFDAGEFARAWLGVSHASGKDESRPSLDHAVNVETFAHGLRLIATDSYVLLHAFINASGSARPTPGLDEVPKDQAVVLDHDGRGKGLMTYLLVLSKAAEKAGVTPPKVRFGIGTAAAVPGATLPLSGLAARTAIFDHPGSEVLALPLYEGEFIDWRLAVGKFKAVSTKAVALNPEILGRLAKLGGLYPEPLVWQFGGVNQMALLELGVIRGAVMPIKQTEDEGGTS